MEQLFLGVNYWAVLISAFMSMLIGSLWYSPFMFGKQWMALNRMSEDDIEKGYPMWLILAILFLFWFFAALAFALFLDVTSTWSTGFIDGLLIAFFWVGTARASAILFERQPFKLFLIHSGYDLICYLIMGTLIGSWH